LNEIVRINCIKHRYPDATEVSVCGLVFEIHEGEKVVVLGSNGSGKTTLLQHIVGVLKPEEGEVEVFGAPPTSPESLHGKVAMVFQNVEYQLVGPTVWDDIAFSPINFGHSKDEVTQMVNEVIEEMQLGSLARRVPHYLSGGEKKKVAIAGAIVTHPKLLILDEALAGLDPKSLKETLDLLMRINRERKIAIVLTTHDVSVIPGFADVVYVLARGKLIYKGQPLELFTHPEILGEANIESPPLIQLLHALKDRGLPVKPTSDPKEALFQLTPLLRMKRTVER
jgi:cobalt/nickel transport system ATP-binding protein